jgi:hypothetical protein
MSQGSPLGIVRRRQVFFLSGFDPKGASHYHRIYAEQAALQGAVSGAAYNVSKRTNCDNGNAVWTVSSGDTETKYEYVRWDDIVRAQWPRGAWQILWSAFGVYALVLREPSALYKIWCVARRTLVALFYPLFFGLLVAALAWAVALGVKVGLSDEIIAGAKDRVSWVLSVLAGMGVLWGGFWLEQRLHTSWLVRIFRFADRYATDRVTDLPKRWDALAEQIRTVLLNPEIDEVLLIGFSVGSVGAVSTAARTVNLCIDTPLALGKLSVLTLGHCIPLFSLMPKAHALRDELTNVGANRELFWIDFSSPSDWGSFALVNPVAICAGRNRGSISEQTVKTINPRVMMSPRFHTLFDLARYAQIKKNKRRMHMQYLMAGELPGAYDFFAMTASGMSLRQRYLQKAV